MNGTTRAREGVAQVPHFDRVNYFYGQLLGVREFQAEQDYFREKLKLHNRCLHGWGIVCGLAVVPGPPAVSPCDPPRAAEQAPPTWLAIEPGLALDCEGNELVVRDGPLVVDVWALLSPEDRLRVPAEGGALWASLCYRECPIEPVRPVLADTCGAPRDCRHGKIRDGVRVRITVEPPPADDGCGGCCHPCGECCVPLARLHFRRGHALRPEDIDLSVQRPVSLYDPTRIVGVSWTHGATYSPHDVNALIGTKTPAAGLTFKFSRPVLVSSIRRGVADVWLLTGGRGPHGAIEYLDVEYVGLPPVVTGHEAVDTLVVRNTTGQTPSPGDRLLIILRTDFLLDRCCRPVDGEHVGGKVPLLPQFSQFARHHHHHHPEPCGHPPHGRRPWTSGNGVAGGTFESWIYVDDNPSEAP